MLLSYRNDSFTVPHTSVCEIVTRGEINDGDIIEIRSPVFSSANGTTRAYTTSDTLNVIARVPNGTITDPSIGTLVCDDNDIFRMYVRIQNEGVMYR
jgi:hypothetical protein